MCQSHNKYKMICVAFHNFSVFESIKYVKLEIFLFLFPRAKSNFMTYLQIYGVLLSKVNNVEQT